jgi:hypothetical protein
MNSRNIIAGQDRLRLNSVRVLSRYYNKQAPQAPRSLCAHEISVKGGSERES